MSSNMSQESSGAHPTVVSANSGFSVVFEGEQELGGGVLRQPSEPENPEFKTDCNTHRHQVDADAITQIWGCYDAPHRVHVAR